MGEHVTSVPPVSMAWRVAVTTLDDGRALVQLLDDEGHTLGAGSIPAAWLTYPGEWQVILAPLAGPDDRVIVWGPDERG